MSAAKRQKILLVDDDRQITDGLGMVLERSGRTVVVCNDIASAELALQSFAFTDVVTDVQFSGLFGFEGLHFLDRVRAASPGSRIVLMTGYVSEALRGAASLQGAAAFLSKPFSVSDLEAVIGTPRSDTAPFELIRVPSIGEILAGGLITSVFQPIVTTGDSNGEPFAYEALTRVKGGWALGPVSTLFEYASRCSRGVELNRAAIVAAITAAASLPRQSLIFVNIDAPTFSDAGLAAEVIAAAARAGVSLDRLVLEVTERHAFDDNAMSARTFATLRAAGVRFALDDHGSAFSHLATIAMIRPSFIKISGAFGTGFETDRDKGRVVRNVLALARDFGCTTVLEGIESQATALAAERLGIELGQGYFFSVPREVSFWTREAA